MIRIYLSYFIPLITLLVSINQNCGAEIDFDYETHPYLPVEFSHLELSATIDADQYLLSGVATYTFSAKVNGLTEILLHASDLAIESVMIDNTEAEFTISSDSLVIQLADSSIKGQNHSLEISWQSTSNFGLLSDYTGNFWSSKNPLSHHFWLPVFDHPRVELTIEADFIIPVETEIMFNGTLAKITSIDENRKKVHYSTKTPVPVTGLGFAYGDFVISEMTAGFTKVRLFSSEVDFTQEERDNLVVEAARLKRAVENYLSFEYPWEGLNIVVLPDNKWEERTHGAGTIYLYQNLGSLNHQLARGVYAQWFGEYLRHDQYFNFDGREGSQFLATALHYSINTEPALIANPDSLFKVDEWNSWQKYFFDEPAEFRATVRESIPGFFRNMKGVIDFDDYAELWYAESGNPRFSLYPKEDSGPESDSLPSVYRVRAQLDELTSTLTLTFSLVEGSGTELASLALIEHGFDGIKNQEVLFTGNQDTVRVEVDPGTEFITFQSADFDTNNLRYESFPLFYLLNQLRSEEAANRALAAQSLKYHTNNPDLQLALNDILNFEEDSLVIASIYGALAAITDGATGTEEQFLQGLTSEYEAVQLASIKALANYRDNEIVKSALRSQILRSTTKDVFATALQVYQNFATSDDLISLISRMQNANEANQKVMHVLFSSDSLHSDERAASIAESFLSEATEYEIRSYALDYLQRFDKNNESWRDRIEELRKDRDPRIRFRAYELVLSFYSKSEALVYLRSAEIDEYDPRILMMIEGVIDSLDE